MVQRLATERNHCYCRAGGRIRRRGTPATAKSALSRWQLAPQRSCSHFKRQRRTYFSPDFFSPDLPLILAPIPHQRVSMTCQKQRELVRGTGERSVKDSPSTHAIWKLICIFIQVGLIHECHVPEVVISRFVF